MCKPFVIGANDLVVVSGCCPFCSASFVTRMPAASLVSLDVIFFGLLFLTILSSCSTFWAVCKCSSFFFFFFNFLFLYFLCFFLSFLSRFFFSRLSSEEEEDNDDEDSELVDDDESELESRCFLCLLAFLGFELTEDLRLLDFSYFYGSLIWL